MRANARIEVARRGRVSVVVDARSEPPLSVRCTPGRVLVVGSAAAPVGGDELDLEVMVGAGATLALGTAAATMVWPGPDGQWSRQSTRIAVADGGHVDWRPEPLVSVAASRHRSSTVVDLRGSATAVMLDEVSLGRTGEQPGRLTIELRVVRDGAPLVHHVEHLGAGVAGWESSAHVGGARHVITGIVVAPGVGRSSSSDVDQASGVSAAWLAMADDVAVVLVVAPDRPAATRALARLPVLSA